MILKFYLFIFNTNNVFFFSSENAAGTTGLIAKLVTKVTFSVPVNWVSFKNAPSVPATLVKLSMLSNCSLMGGRIN